MTDTPVGWTKGPWLALHCGKLVRVTRSFRRGAVSGHEPICGVHRRGVRTGKEVPGEAWANAHLIAASPCLARVAELPVITLVEEQEEYVRLFLGGVEIAVHHHATAEGIALLKFEAERSDALSRARGER